MHGIEQIATARDALLQIYGGSSITNRLYVWLILFLLRRQKPGTTWIATNGTSYVHVTRNLKR